MMKKTCIGLVAAWAAVCAFAAPQVVLLDGTVKEGTDVRANSKGDIILKTAAGDVTYFKGQYREVKTDQPPEWAQVPPLLAAKKYDEAIILLNAIATKMRYLGWDVTARLQIARIQGELQNKPKDAIDTFETLFRDNPEAKANSQALWAYLTALAKGDDAAKAKLGPALDQMVKSPDRTMAARAQNLRGDVKMASGDVRGAARDYLRTIILFQAEEDAQPEALYKAGEALEKMKDARAKKMYATLIQKYGETEWAAKAKAKGSG